MDQSSTIIKKIFFPAYKKIAIETKDGSRFEADLSLFEKVYCFPKNFSKWKKAWIDGYGLGVIWESRFEVHVDQIIGLATKNVRLKKAS